MKMKKMVIFFFIIVGVVLFFYNQNNSLVITNVELKLDKLPLEFEGLKIVHLSDLHGKLFGKNQYKLVSKIKESEPDVIFFTGDLVDSKKNEVEHALTLMEEITNIAPVYYVTGNHEHRSGRYDSLEGNLLNREVIVLRNTKDVINRDSQSIEVLGIDDPSSSNDFYHSEEQSLVNALEKALEGSEKDSFKILLSHRPEFLSIYAEHNIDLIFSGHAHGGQVRLPILGGIIAPNQGLLPKYTSGQYNEGKSTMIVSRGLGNSIIPQRVFNRPEIIVIKLSTK